MYTRLLFLAQNINTQKAKLLGITTNETMLWSSHIEKNISKVVSIIIISKHIEAGCLVLSIDISGLLPWSMVLCIKKAEPSDIKQPVLS